MKKITLLLFALLITSIGFSQEVIQDFESSGALGGPFGGASASIVDDPETGGTRGKVALLTATSTGQVFQGININLLKNVEVTATKEMTIDVFSNSPITFAPKVLNGIQGAPASTTSATHGGTGWETLTLTFDKGYDGTTTANGVYTLFVIYYNWKSDNSGFVNPAIDRVFYVDNISGIAVQPVVDPIPPTAAPSPTNSDPAIINIYSDTGAFKDNSIAWPQAYDFGSNGGNVDLDDTAGTNNALKMNFSNAGWGAGSANPVDITNYTHVHFDYYAPAMDAGVNGHQVRFIIIGEGQGEKNYELTPAGSDGTLVFDAWQQVDVPLTFFEAKGLTKDKFLQYKLGTESDLNTKIVYFDNIYIYNSATASVNNNELLGFSMFPNPATDRLNISAKETIQKADVFNVLGKNVMSVTVNDTKASIDISNLASGIYLVKYNVGNTTGTAKFIKQ